MTVRLKVEEPDLVDLNEWFLDFPELGFGKYGNRRFLPPVVCGNMGYMGITTPRVSAIEGNIITTVGHSPISRLRTIKYRLLTPRKQLKDKFLKHLADTGYTAEDLTSLETIRRVLEEWPTHQIAFEIMRRESSYE